MSIDAMRWALMQHGISSSQKFVLVVLADRANEAHECWPSVDRLSLDTELDPRTVQRALVALEEGGLIKTQSRPGRSNVFKLIGVVGREDETPRQKASQKNNTPGTVPPPAESHPRHGVTPGTVPPPAVCHPRHGATPLQAIPPAQCHPRQSAGAAESRTPPAECRGRGDTVPPRTISESKRTVGERGKACRGTPRSRSPRKFHSRFRGDKHAEAPMPAGQNLPAEDHDGRKPYGELQNVWLTDSEFEFLTTKRGKQATLEAINQVSLYKAEHGKEIASDLAAVLRWGYTAVAERKQVAQPAPATPEASRQSSVAPTWEMSEPAPGEKTPGMGELVRNALNGDASARDVLESKKRPRL